MHSTEKREKCHCYWEGGQPKLYQICVLCVKDDDTTNFEQQHWPEKKNTAPSFERLSFFLGVRMYHNNIPQDEKTQDVFLKQHPAGIHHESMRVLMEFFNTPTVVFSTKNDKHGLNDLVVDM